MSRSQEIRAFVERRPNACFWTFAGLHGALSTFAPALFFPNLPIDVVEGFLWSRSLDFGYHKHPAAAAAVLALIDRCGGWHTLAYAASQIFVVATFRIVFDLSRSIVGPVAALVATVLLAGVHYYSIAAAAFNPDVVLYPLWAFFALAVWRAVGEEKRRWWFGVAASLGLMVHAKYTGVLIAVSLAAWMTTSARGRRAFAAPFFWLAILGATAVAAPHLVWLANHEFLPLAYAADRPPIADLGGRLAATIELALAQVGQHAGLVAMALAASLPLLRPAQEPDWTIAVAPVSTEARRFVLFAAFGPTTIMLVAQLFADAQFRQMWGAPFFAFSGLALVVLAGDRLTLRNMPIPLVVAAVVLIAPPLVNALQYRFPGWFVPNQRMIYPSAAIESRMLAVYRRETGHDPKIVIADFVDGGAIALDAPGRPLVMIDGDPRSTPAVTPELLAREGALVVWAAARGDRPVVLLDAAESPSRDDPTVWTRPILETLAPQGSERFERPGGRFSHPEPLVLDWAILPPTAPR